MGCMQSAAMGEEEYIRAVVEVRPPARRQALPLAHLLRTLSLLLRCCVPALLPDRPYGWSLPRR